uniref:Uncharacterized protein n=1 Tax=Lactuca sativa TaxID=4236 RepID=A0A9R1XK54_LACSA|nr:hypothetical protein LSAT_V11C300144610 [Lactuca sativa]
MLITEIEVTLDTSKYSDEKDRFAKCYRSIVERKVERYIWGLRTNIREFVEIQKLGTLYSTINVAQGREREKNRQGEIGISGKVNGIVRIDSKKIKISGKDVRLNCPQNKANNNQRMVAEKGNQSGDENEEMKRVKGIASHMTAQEAQETPCLNMKAKAFRNKYLL